MLYDITGVYEKVGQSGRHDDDVFDRYSHRWTVILLGIFIIAVSAKQFVGVPIECIPPSDFGGQHKTYVENYCWIHYTYSVDDEKPLTRDLVRGENGSRITPYYIWIPYILVGAAILTYLPAWLWHVIGHRATIDIPAMINQLAKTNLSDTEERKKSLTVLVNHYENARRYTKESIRITDNVLKRLISLFMFFAGGGVLTGIYFLTKIFYLMNAIGQFVFINHYLEIDYWSYGQKVLRSMLTERGWLDNKVLFPRIVYCDFTIRYLGDNNPNYTVQCTLPVNLYNERIFAFYWFWLICLTCITFYGIIIWLGHMSYHGRRSFLKKHIRINLGIDLTEKDAELFNKFADHLGGDGIFFVRLIAINTNPVIAGELLAIMWQQYVGPKKVAVNVISPKENIKDIDTYLNGGDLSAIKED